MDMKKLILILLFAFTAGVSIYAQCGKKVFITANKTEYPDPNGNVERRVDEFSTVVFDDKEISMTWGDEHSAKGPIKSLTCEWKIPFKQGKTVLKASVGGGSEGEPKNVTITIEGKDGKISFIATVDDQPDRKIQLIVDKFEEKK